MGPSLERFLHAVIMVGSIKSFISNGLDFFVASILPTRPVLLIEDGHSSHISLEVIKLAKENDIHLLCLPVHTTHLLQPLDVGVFRCLKSNFSKMCKQFLAVNPGQVITTDLIASLLA